MQKCGVFPNMEYMQIFLKNSRAKKFANSCKIIWPYLGRVKRIWYLSHMRAAKFRRACASAQSCQNLRYSLIQAASQEEPSDRKPDPWPLWMTGHARLKFVMTECSMTQICLTHHIFKFALLTCKLLTTGTGVTGCFTGPIPSKNVYSALSVLIIVHDAPSFTISLFASFGHGVAWNWIIRSCDKHKYIRSVSFIKKAHLWSCETGSSASSTAVCLSTLRITWKVEIVIIVSESRVLWYIWAEPWENVSYVICEQQRRRSACASAQSDQRLCCSLLG